jgi:transposase-like protein
VHKAKRKEVWFQRRGREGLSIRQIRHISRHSGSKLKRIKNQWLQQESPELYEGYKRVKYLIFDGRYFKRRKSLLSFMNDGGGKVISRSYVGSENYANAYKMAEELKGLGVEPKSVTLDGLKPVIAAIKDVWPKIIIQRCLYHIEHPGLMWLRSKPKTEAGRELREIYKGITGIKDEEGKVEFTKR